MVDKILRPFIQNRWTVFWIVVWLALAAVVVLGFQLWASHLVDQSMVSAGSQELTNRSAAAEHLSFVYGWAFTVIVAIVTVVAAVLAAKFVNRQEDIAILDFATQKFSTMNDALLKVGRGFGELFGLGRDIYANSFSDEKLLRRVVEQLQLEVANLRAKFGQDIPPREWNDAMDRVLDTELPDVKAAAIDIGAVIDLISTNLEDLAREPFSSLILRQEFQGNDQEPNLLAFALECATDDVARLMDTELFIALRDRHLIDLTFFLTWLASELKTGKFFFSYRYLPNKWNVVEWIGLSLLMADLPADPKARTSDNRVIERYVVNVGLALIATIYQLIPDRKRAVEIFQSIFPNRSEIAENFASHAGPDVQSVLAFHLKLQFDRLMPTFSSHNWGDLRHLTKGGGILYVVVQGERDPQSYVAEVHGRVLIGK